MKNEVQDKFHLKQDLCNLARKLEQNYLNLLSEQRLLRNEKFYYFSLFLF